MTKRYYMCRVIGNGQDVPYTSELRQYIQERWNVNCLQQAIYPNALLWAVMKYDLTEGQHDEAMSNVSHLFSFPPGALDKQLSEFPAEERLAIKNKLENIGFDFGWATLGNTLRDILKYIVHSIQLASWAQIPIANKNFNLFTSVTEIPFNARNRIAQQMQKLNIDTAWITSTHTVNNIIQKIMFYSDSYPRLFKDGRQWFYYDKDIE